MELLGIASILWQAYFSVCSQLTIRFGYKHPVLLFIDWLYILLLMQISSFRNYSGDFLWHFALQTSKCFSNQVKASKVSNISVLPNIIEKNNYIIIKCTAFLQFWALSNWHDSSLCIKIILNYIHSFILSLLRKRKAKCGGDN